MTSRHRAAGKPLWSTSKDVCRAFVLPSILAVVAACGDGGSGEGSTAQGPAAISTLAYVVTECRLDAEGPTMRQSLQIRRGEQAPITVVEHAAVVDPVVQTTCPSIGFFRQSTDFADLGVFRRLGVSPDGSLVVFEVTDEIRFGVLGPLVFPFNALPAEQKGIFAVAADGTGLRRLGPASRVASYWQSFFLFSPSGRLVAYTDEGPGPDDAVGVAAGSAAVQIFTLDVETGDRTQVTRLPPGTGPFGGTYQPFFNDEHTITFSTKADLDGSNPSHKNLIVTVKTDGTGLTVAPPVVALPGAEVLTSFRIAGADLAAAGLNVDIPAENPVPGYEMSHEVFAIDRDDNILQLTTFGRYDTWHPMVSADGERVLFSASADPLGTNPTNNCQIFSIHPTGADLRQLTHFQEVPDGLHAIGCSFGPLPLGCGAYFLGRDLQTDTVLFNSWCDPFGTNPNGNQLFAMRADGTGLRQLTTARGYTQDASGVLTVEAPFPFAWPGLRTWEQIP